MDEFNIECSQNDQRICTTHLFQIIPNTKYVAKKSIPLEIMQFNEEEMQDNS